MNARNFAAELDAARASNDWDACERIWEERRVASVEADEAMLIGIAKTEAEYAAEDAALAVAGGSPLTASTVKGRHEHDNHLHPRPPYPLPVLLSPMQRTPDASRAAYSLDGDRR